MSRKFSIVKSPLNLQYKTTVELTFQKILELGVKELLQIMSKKNVKREFVTGFTTLNDSGADF